MSNRWNAESLRRRNERNKIRRMWNDFGNALRMIV